MLWIIVFVVTLKGISAGHRGSSITCACSTTHCLEHRMAYCNTSGMCFSQYLDRKDGSHPVIRGCISSKTPLLCENRRPAIARGTWPVLLCCNSTLCNQGAVPTAPPWLVKEDTKNQTVPLLGHQSGFSDDKAQRILPDAPNSSEPQFSQLQPPDLELSVPLNTPFRSKSRSSSLPHIVSPVYISVLVLGIVSLVIIGIVAATVLRRSNRFYMEQYGALEHQNDQEFLKQARLAFSGDVHVHCDCDSEVESVSQCSQPYVHVIYPDRPTSNT